MLCNILHLCFIILLLIIPYHYIVVFRIYIVVYHIVLHCVSLSYLCCVTYSVAFVCLLFIYVVLQLYVP
jgi:hypothetical protein